MKIARISVFFMMATAVFGLDAVEPSDQELDRKLGMHSDGGRWGFKSSKMKGELPRVLLIGDSIVNGYQHQVIRALEDEAAVDCWLTPAHLNSKDLRAKLRRVLEQRPYDVVHFNIGLHGWVPGRIPEGEYEPLLRNYVEVMKANAQSARLIWASSTQLTVQGQPTVLDPVHNKTIVDRNAIAAQVMPSYGIAVNDLYGLMSDKLTLARGDRFHWNAAGYQLMGAQIVQQIEAALAAKPVVPDGETKHRQESK